MYKKLLLFVFLLGSISLWAADYYCDPNMGSMSNNGSSNAPWSTLHDVFAAGKTFNAGDVIYLRTGNHGFAVVEGANNGDVIIRPEEGQSPYLERIRFGNNNAVHWVLDGVEIISENEDSYPENLIDLYPGSSFITIKNCRIHSIEDASNWTRDNWRDQANTGIRSQGHDHLIQDNEIKNIYLGVSIESPHTMFKGNTIQRFTIDGIRALASFCTYIENKIMDAIVVYDNSENHYDGFQSYTCCPVGSDTLFDVIVKRNIIIQTTDADRDFLGTMQGMGCFDGMYVNWEIENNLVLVDHWHGISLYGAIDCKIINNTVIDPDGVLGIGPSWIKIATHKMDGTVNNGALSTGNVIRNNLVNQLSNADNIGEVDHNELLGDNASDYDNYFIDATSLDFHLLESAPAVDAGSDLLAPNIDLENNPRPEGNGIDIGAYEYKMPDAVKEAGSFGQKISISPNPANSWMEIEVAEPTTISIIDMKGAVVYAKVNFESGQINVSQWEAGVYTIIFSFRKRIFAKKLIILN